VTKQQSRNLILGLSIFAVAVRIPQLEIRNHLITLSARASTFGVMLKPICLAVLKWTIAT
jgi:hypothetical protein